MSIVKKLSDPKTFSKIMSVLKIPTEQIEGEDFSYNLKWNGKEFENGDYPELVKATSDKLKSLMEKTEYRGQVSLKGKLNDTTISLSELQFNTSEALEVPEEKKSDKDLILKENEGLKQRMKQNRERLKEIDRIEQGEKIEKEITEKIKKIYEKKLEEEKKKMDAHIKKIKKAIKITIKEDDESN